MSDPLQIPEKCRFVSGHLSRAREVRKADPIISYLCKLKAVQDVLATNLHREDPQVMQFVSGLLDEIENLKQNDESLTSESGKAILEDDTTAQAYVEQVAGRVLDKADNEIRGGRATMATSVGLLAAVTFMDLYKLFSPSLTPELQEKTKYAKYHAARIVKALKAGQDPNASAQQETDTPNETSTSLHSLVAPSKLPSVEVPTQSTCAPDRKVNAIDIKEAASAIDINKAASAIDIKKATSDAEAMTKAQKHAKLAISALNFEDVETGKKQLKLALELLEELSI